MCAAFRSAKSPRGDDGDETILFARVDIQVSIYRKRKSFIFFFGVVASLEEYFKYMML
jgi:hypothetical protein